MDFGQAIAQRRKRFDQLEAQIAEFSFFDNPRKARELMREHSGLKRLMELWSDLELAVRSDRHVPRADQRQRQEQRAERKTGKGTRERKAVHGQNLK